MKTILLILSICSTLHFVFSQTQRPIGINLTSVEDYSTELVFTDAFKQSRQWTSANADGSGPWDTQINIPLNSNGFPLEIPYTDGTNLPQKARALMIWDLNDATPIGTYRLIVEGTGQVALNFGANGSYNCPVDTLVNVNGPVSLEITQSNATNPISNIQFIYPDFVNTYQNQTFHPQFLEFVQGFSVIRFMDWLRTNNSTVTSWADRTHKNNYTQASHTGVAWEYIIELANTANKDIWINIPHLANNAYIDSLADLLQTTLNPHLNIYLEYSNETWNSIFTQNAETANLAQATGYTGQPWERTWKYTAKRSADVFHHFETAFGVNSNRLVKTIPSQSVNTWLTNEILTYFNDPLYNPTGVSADAIAIAPYFAGSVANTIADNNEVTSISVEEIVQRMQASLAQNLTEINDNIELANQHNLRLLCYEAGQHLTATGAHVDNDALTAKLIAANLHSDLQEVYCNYFDQWFEHAADLMMHFSSHGNYSKWGSWGIKVDMNDIDNPKYLAIQQCVFANNETSVSVPNLNTQETPFIYPNPTSDMLHFTKAVNKFNITDVSGKIIQSGKSTTTIDVSSLKKGIYFLHIDGSSYTFIKE